MLIPKYTAFWLYNIILLRYQQKNASFNFLARVCPLSNGLDVKNNSADDAGSVLYGGTIDKCKLTSTVSSGKVFGKLIHIEDDADYNTTSKISSEPFHMHL